MRRVVAAGACLLLAGFLPAQEDPAPQEGTPVNAVVLTEGILGGIAPPHVRFRLVLVEQEDGSARLAVKEQPRRDQPPTFRQGTLDAQAVAALWSSIADAHLYELPVEPPAKANHDVYGQDTALAVRHAGRSWRNGAPEGCVRGVPTVKVTPEQRDTFARLATRVRDLARHATSDCEAAAFAELEAATGFFRRS